MNWSGVLAINWGQWIPIGISFLVAMTGLYLALDNRRLRGAQVERDESTASAAITRSALSLVGPMQSKIATLEGQVSDLTTRLTINSQRTTDLEHGIQIRDAELEGLRAGVVVLTSQLKRLSIVPEYNPPPQTTVDLLAQKA